jgi:CBS domain-containing protein/mannitol/fructose-specific phosphotransferase system IIA component (Ntr-type)
MPIKDFLSEEQVFLDKDFNDLDEVLLFLSEKFSEKTGKDKEFILDLLKKREEISSTWIGEETVLPHNHNSEISGIHIIFIRCVKPFILPDDHTARFIFSILTSGKEDQTYLGVLQGIGRLMKESKEDLINCPLPAHFMKLIDESVHMDGKPLKAVDLAGEWPVIQSDAPISEALDLMKKHNVYFLPVISSDKGSICGVLDFVDLLKAGFPDYVFSLSDLSLIQDFKPVKYFWKKENELFVREFIRDYRPYIVRSDASYPEIFFLMIKGNRRHLLVLDRQEKLVGVIYPTNIIDKMLRP